jgi:hypothetical protein
MKIEITSTDKTTTMDGVTVRVWEGVAEGGARCVVFVHRIAVHEDEDSTRFESELVAQLPPGRHLPLSLIL